MPITPPHDLRTIVQRMAYVLPLFLPLYTIRFRIGPFPTTLLELFIVVLLAVYTGQGGWNGWKAGWHRIGMWRTPITAWFFVTLLSVFVAPHIVQGIGLWRAYVLEPLLVFLVFADVLRTHEDLIRFRRHFFATVLILGVWALFQFLTGQGIPHPWDVSIQAGRRATGPFPFPNALALFVAPITIWAFFTWLDKRSDSLSLITFLVGLVSILLARSDGALLAVGTIAWFGLVARKDMRRFAVYALLIGFFVWLVTPPLRNALQKELTFKSWSGQVRLYIWRETWQMLKAHPIMGAGFGGYPAIFEPYHKAKAIEIFQYPHTIVFNLWSETGLAGLAVFVSIVLVWMRLVYRQAGFRGLLMGTAPLCVILIHGLVDVPYFKNDLAVSFWLLAWAMTIAPRNDDSTHLLLDQKAV